MSLCRLRSLLLEESCIIKKQKLNSNSYQKIFAFLPHINENLK